MLYNVLIDNDIETMNRDQLEDYGYPLPIQYKRDDFKGQDIWWLTPFHP